MKLRALLHGLLLLGVAAPADAVVAEIWSRFSVQFTNVGRAEASSTSGGLATLNASSASSSQLASVVLPALSLVETVPVTDPEAFPVISVRLDLRQRPDLQGGGAIGNVSGAVASTAGGLAPDTIPTTGVAKLCIFLQPPFLPPCYGNVPLPAGGTTAGGHHGVGVGGLLTIGGLGTIRLSVVGAPYTVKTVSAVNRTQNGFQAFHERGFAHGPASLTGSTAQVSGVLQLVTASHVGYAGPGFQDRFGSFARVQVHFVPEPSAALLLGFGAVLAAGLGRRRGR